MNSSEHSTAVVLPNVSEAIILKFANIVSASISSPYTSVDKSNVANPSNKLILFAISTNPPPR